MRAMRTCACPIAPLPSARCSWTGPASTSPARCLTSNAVGCASPSLPLIFYFPAADALSRARTRRTKADTDKLRWASRSADRRTARSRRCTSSQRTTHVRPRRACSLLSGARRCAGCYIRRNKLAAALRGARINLRMRMLAMGSGVGLRLRYAPVPSPYLSSSPLLSLVCGAH